MRSNAIVLLENIKQSTLFVGGEGYCRAAKELSSEYPDSLFENETFHLYSRRQLWQD